MSERTVRVLADAGALAEAVALWVADAARVTLLARETFTIALSGGETPRAAYERLGTRHAGDVDWSRVKVFFGDERCVPPDDARSNYALARETLLSRVPVPAGQVFRMYEAGDDPAAAAARYEALLRAEFPALSAADPPTFDVALQGVGPDGHTASLFPGDAGVLGESQRWVRAVQAPDGFPVRDRITVTVQALNRSRRVLFVASGAGKRDVVSRVLHGRDTGLTAALVRGLESTEWLLDAAAAP